MLARPQESLELVHPAHTKTDEVSITSLGFPLGETTSFWVGTEEGNVYSANRYDRAGAKAGLNQNEVYKGHSGPVTGMSFHPVEGRVDLSDLFLTCGVDWTIKLWRAGTSSSSSTSNSTNTNGQSSSTTTTSTTTKPSTLTTTPGVAAIAPLFSFEEADDYVYDVKWHPHHPALFASVDGAGKFDLWNLNLDTEVSQLFLFFLLLHALPELRGRILIHRLRTKTRYRSFLLSSNQLLRRRHQTRRRRRTTRGVRTEVQRDSTSWHGTRRKGNGVPSLVRMVECTFTRFLKVSFFSRIVLFPLGDQAYI